MKAVVLQINKGYASVLSDDGCFVNVKNKDYEIGQVIQMSNPKNKLSKKFAAIAASAAAVIVIGTGTWAYASPYSYVSLDVNPSIEFTVNRFDRVLKVKAVNDDGEEILQEIKLEDLENKSIEDAITKTVEQITEAGYFDGTVDGGIVITTSGKDENKADELASELQDAVEEELDEITDNSENIEVEAYSVGLERVKEAHVLGVTPGKLNLVEKLKASAADPNSINIEEWLNRPVKDIMKARKENRIKTATGSSLTIKAAEKQKPSKALEARKKADEKKLEAQKKADVKKLEAQKKADEKKLEVQKKADEKKLEIQKKADEKNLKAQKKSEVKSNTITKKAEKSDKSNDKAAEKSAEKPEKSNENASKKITKAEDTSISEAKRASEAKNKEADKVKAENISGSSNTDKENGQSGNNGNKSGQSSGASGNSGKGPKK